MKTIKPFIKYIITGLILLSSLFYVITYNSNYSELESLIEREDYESAKILIGKLDKYPLKIKNIDELKSVTILSTLDSLPEFIYSLKNSYSSEDDSLRVKKNNIILKDLDLVNSNNPFIKLEKLTITANLLLNNIYLSTTDAIINDIKYINSSWEKDNLKFTGYQISNIFDDSDYTDFSDFIEEYKNLGAEYHYTYKSEIDSIGDDVSAAGIYNLAIDSNKEIAQVINDYQIVEIKNKNDFRDIQSTINADLLTNLVDNVIRDFDLEDLESFSPKRINHEMMTLLNIIAIVYPSIENIKNFTGVDLLEDNLVCCSVYEQDKMASLIKSLVPNFDLRRNNTKDRFTYYNKYSKDLQNIYSLFDNYLDEPFNQGKASNIRSGSLFSIIANPYLCDFCRFDFLGNNSLAGYIEFSSSYHKKLNNKEKKFAVSLAELAFVSDERFLTIDNNSNIRYGIYKWYREYLSDIGNKTKELQVHNKLANINDNDDDLNKYKARTLADSYFWIANGVKWDRKDWGGAISDFNNALKYLEYTNYDNEANPELWIEGLSKAKILRQRGLAKMLYEYDNGSIKKLSDSTGCLDLRTASNLDSEYYDDYVQYCLN